MLKISAQNYAIISSIDRLLVVIMIKEDNFHKYLRLNVNMILFLYSFFFSNLYSIIFHNATIRYRINDKNW